MVAGRHLLGQRTGSRTNASAFSGANAITLASACSNASAFSRANTGTCASTDAGTLPGTNTGPGACSDTCASPRADAGRQAFDDWLLA